MFHFDGLMRFYSVSQSLQFCLSRLGEEVYFGLFFNKTIKFVMSFLSGRRPIWNVEGSLKELDTIWMEDIDVLDMFRHIKDIVFKDRSYNLMTFDIIPSQILYNKRSMANNRVLYKSFS